MEPDRRNNYRGRIFSVPNNYLHHLQHLILLFIVWAHKMMSSHCERHYQQEVHFFPAELSEQRDPACVRQVVNFASRGKVLLLPSWCQVVASTSVNLLLEQYFQPDKRTADKKLIVVVVTETNMMCSVSLFTCPSRQKSMFGHGPSRPFQTHNVSFWRQARTHKYQMTSTDDKGRG